jgi:hypothetical protein
MKESPRSFGDLLDGHVECFLIGLRWFVEPAQLAHELKCRCLDLFIRGWRLEVE